MSLVINEEQQMLMDSAAEYFSEKTPVSAFRELRGSEQAIDEDVWQSIVDFGWPAILAPEELGGLGFGITGLGLIAIEAGKNLAVSPLFSSAAISMDALLQCEATSSRDELIQAILAGESKVVLAFGEGHRFQPDSIRTTAAETEKGFELNGTKTYVAEGGYADKVLLVARHASTLNLFAVAGGAKGLAKTNLELLDRRDYAEIEFTNVQCEANQKLSWAADSKLDDSAAVARLTNVGALLTACELYGCASEAFERTRVYLCDREQFGRKIGTFQALQHRMAHAYTQMELLKSVLLDALGALESNRKDASLAVSHAKTLANTTARLVSQEAIQMHGGIGITDELDIGLFYKRIRVLQTVYGDSNYHKNRFANLSGY